MSWVELGRGLGRPQAGRLEHGAAALGLAGGEHCEAGGRGRVPDGGGLPVVVGERGEVVVEIGAVDGLDRIGDPAVQAASTDRRRSVASVSHERVGEPHLLARRSGLFHEADQEGRLERVERRVGAHAARFRQHVDTHRGAGDRGHAQHGRESSGSRSTRRRTTSRTLAGTVAAATPSCRPLGRQQPTSSVRKKGFPAVRPWSASAAAGSRSRAPTSRAKDRTCSGPSPVSSTRTRSDRRASDPRVDADRLAHLVGTEGGEHGDRPVLQLGGEVVEQPQGVGVGPVDVLEDDDDRLGLALGRGAGDRSYSCKRSTGVPRSSPAAP